MSEAQPDAPGPSTIQSEPPGPSTNEADGPGPSTIEADASTPPAVWSRRLSRPGFLGAGVFYALSLLSSLLPRTAITQGVISGVTIAIGYGLGVAVHWAWDYLEVPRTRGLARRIVAGAALVVVVFMIGSAVWRHVGWQNEARALMGMEPTAPTLWPAQAGVTLAVAASLVLAGRLLRRLLWQVVSVLGRRLPPRQAGVAGWLVMGALAWGLWSGVLTNGFFAAANLLFAPRDTATDDGVVAPTSDLRSGSPASAVTWQSLGRQGRNFVAGGPTVEELNDVHGGGAVEPIRVYAGLKSADTVQDRADLVLAELQRTGAFDRSVLVVATTTGTGFLDADGVDPLEWVANGDTAVAGVQYSYLPSWISLLADQAKVEDTSRIVFDTIQSHWSTLPEDRRPGLYLYGLSLGSLGVEAILDSVNIVNEPIDGALMVGPPFVNPLHDRLVAERDAGSPATAPVVDAGRTVRFMTQFTTPINTHESPESWGPTRILYVAHASDPVVYFSPDLAFSPPDWLEPDQRGPEIAGSFTWAPLVTMWQVLVDLPEAGAVPQGFAHLYDKPTMARAWAAVTANGMSHDELADLEATLARLPHD